MLLYYLITAQKKPKCVILSNRLDLFQTQRLLVEINILNKSQACTYPK